MSIGPIPITASTAGTPLAQSKGSAVERSKEEIDSQQRQTYYEEEAAAAAGVGQPDGENHETAQRDGDGRRPWEDQPDPPPRNPQQKNRQSKDPSHQSGNLLDLTG
jgi:hypothetical protein